MIYNFLSSENHKFFSDHYNKLRTENKVVDILDVNVILNFWEKYPEIHFECALKEVTHKASIGILQIKNKKFAVAVTNNQICLMDKLENFLKAK